MSVSKCLFDRMDFKVWWSILAKNFLMSHLRTKQVRVLFFETFRLKVLNLSIALCVPLFILQEYESWMNFLSKYG